VATVRAPRVAAFLASVGLLTACGGGPTATTGTATPALITTASPTPAANPFVSSHYGYSVTSSDWTGTNAKGAWDGTGAPGDTSPSVDTLAGPQGERAWAFGERTRAGLQAFVASLRRVNVRLHPCAIEPASSASITVGGEPAILDQEHCAPHGGPFVITAYVIHAGHGYVFFTYSISPGSEHFTRSWFIPFLGHISFAA
jgi:hypothetical protein